MPGDERILRPRGELLHQPEVGHLDVIAEDQQVFRLDVQVQQAVPLREEVERFGRVGHVLQQLVARDAGEPFGAALAEPLVEAHVGQLGQNRQPAVDDLEPFERQQERMPHALDPLQRLELLRGELVVVVAVDDLDRFLDAARRLGPPHLGVAARADAIGQRVAGQHDVAGLSAGRHEQLRTFA